MSLTCGFKSHSSHHKILSVLIGRIFYFLVEWGGDEMDDKTWQQYEEKHVALRKKYRALYWKTWLLWIAYYAATSTAAILICHERYFNAMIYFFVLNTFFPLFITMRHIAKLRREKEKQRRALVESAPVGKFQLY